MVAVGEVVAALVTAQDVAQRLQALLSAADETDERVQRACRRYASVVTRLDAMTQRGENVEPRVVQVCVERAERLVAALERYRDGSWIKRTGSARRAVARAEALNALLDDMREEYFYAVSAFHVRQYLRSEPQQHYLATHGRAREPSIELQPSAPPLEQATSPPPAPSSTSSALDWVVAAITGAPTDPVDAAWEDFRTAQSQEQLLSATRALAGLAGRDAAAGDRLLAKHAHRQLTAIVQVEDNAPELRTAAMATLQALCAHPANRVRVGESKELVSALVRDLFVGLQAPAAQLLAAMAQDCEAVQLLVRETTAVDALAAMLQHGDVVALQAAAAALWRLVPLDEIKDQVAESECVGGLRRALQHDVHEAARALALLAADDRLDEIIGASGCIDELTRWLSHESRMHRSCAAWAFSSLADNAENRVRIVTAGAVTPLVQLVATGSQRQVEHATMTLWWVSELDAGRAAIVAASGWDALLSLLSNDSGDVRLAAAGALSKLPTDERVRQRMAQTGALSIVVRVLSTAEDSWLSECLVTLLSNCAADEHACAALRDAGALPVMTCIARKHAMPTTKLDVLQTLARVARFPSFREDVVAANAPALLVAVLQLRGAEQVQQQALTMAVDALLSDAALCDAFVQADGIAALLPLLEAAPTETQVLATQVIAQIASVPATVQSIHPAADLLLQLMEVSPHAKVALERWHASFE
ncbi:hypothetical protein PINS_up010161 [Pythium insidiosum]|nr:hypothetical protein PINS_up010161 [Pythium insidiosum]